jgi:tRNA(fMet)-specific endonuclease VapC
MSGPRFLLDTNILSDLIRNPSGAVARQIGVVGSRGIATSIVSVAELRYGCAKRGSARLLRQVEAVLDAIDVVPFEPPADVIYGRIRADLEAAGRPIGPNDLLIAAQALALEVPLVTANEAEFRRVDGLTVENWL